MATHLLNFYMQDHTWLTFWLVSLAQLPDISALIL